MPTVRYTVIDGAVMSELRSAVNRDYVPDPLGSTAALLDNTQTATDTFSYWPYGEEKSRTGSTTTPFGFVGTMGYYKDSSTRTYVRARSLDTGQGRWITQDPLGFDAGDMNLYRYVGNSPVGMTDPSGLQGGNLACWAREYMDLVRGGMDPRQACLIAARMCGLPLGSVDCNNPPDVPAQPTPCTETCSALEGRGFPYKSPDAAINSCKKTGEKCKRSESSPANACAGGRHYGYDCPRSGYITVLCCPCTTDKGGNGVRCRCRYH